MSNIQSYNALIDRFHAFASGHFILKRFSHGQIEVSDLEKFGEYPFMHVVPSNVSYSKGMKTFSFQIVLADLPRDKEDKSEYQREVLSDLQRIAEDLVAEITNHRMLFGDLITVQNVSLEPFLEEFQHTLTGWTISLDLLVPYYWDACSIPAEWNDFFESGSGGTGSILTFIDSINRDNNGNVSLVNDETTPAPNYYYGTNDEGVRGWYLLEAGGGLTCETIGDCQTIIDMEIAIEALDAEIILKADISSISAVGFSNDYEDLSNLPTIPTATSDLTNDGADGVNPFITAQDLPDTSGFVPYTGATQDVDLGEFELKAGQVEFDQTPTGTAGVGVMRWNDSDGTLDLGLKGGNVTLQIGQESVLRVVNKTATNVNLLEANYQAVRVTGAQGQRLKVDLALATTDGLSAETIGLVTETINNNQEGFITTSGLVRGINTTGSLQGETWADGDILYLSPTTAGRATKVKPTAPNHLIILGYVIHAHINQGSIFVKVDNGYELDELHNVKITTAANNNVLAYTSATDLWENKTVETALGFTPVTNARTISTTAPLSGGGDLSANRTLSIPQATTSVDGYLSSTDWTTFNGKQAAITGAATTITTADLTASRVLVSDGSGKVAANAVTTTTLGFLDATSSIQTQLNAKGYAMGGNLNGSAIAVGTTYIGIGTGTTSTTETARRTSVLAGTVSRLFLRTSGVMTGSMAITLMKNGVATAMTFTIPATSAGGLYSTTSNTFTVVDGDELSIRIVQSTAISSGVAAFGFHIK